MNRRPPATQHRAFDLVVVAGSIGGIAGLTTLLQGLPAFVDVPIAAVLHRARTRTGRLREVIARASPFPVVEPFVPTPLRGATVYLAPADRHLVVTEPETIAPSDAPPIGRFRPAADLLFESAARVFGARTLGVVLSGALYDGAAGARAIKAAGGRVLVQCDAPEVGRGMPTATVRTGSADFMLPIDALAKAITALTAVEGVAELFAVSPFRWLDLAG